MNEKFAGVGLRNVLIIWLMVMVLIVMAKVVFNRYQVAGVTEVVNAV